MWNQNFNYNKYPKLYTTYICSLKLSGFAFYTYFSLVFPSSSFKSLALLRTRNYSLSSLRPSLLYLFFPLTFCPYFISFSFLLSVPPFCLLFLYDCKIFWAKTVLKIFSTSFLLSVFSNLSITNPCPLAIQNVYIQIHFESSNTIL